MKNYNDVECVFLHGRTTDKIIIVPEEWEKEVDLTSLSVHLTPIGGDQKLIVKHICKISDLIQERLELCLLQCDKSSKAIK